MAVINDHQLTDSDICPVCEGRVVRVCFNELKAQISSLNTMLGDAIEDARWFKAELYQAQNPEGHYPDYTENGLLYRFTGERYEPLPLHYKNW